VVTIAIYIAFLLNISSIQLQSIEQAEDEISNIANVITIDSVQTINLSNIHSNSLPIHHPNYQMLPIQQSLDQDVYLIKINSIARGLFIRYCGYEELKDNIQFQFYGFPNLLIPVEQVYS